MRIGVDARELCGHSTGVGRYLGEIVRAWAALPAAGAHEFAFCSPQPLTIPGAEGLRATVHVAPGRGLAWEQVVLPQLLRKTGADVLFSPGYSGPLSGRTPMVLVIHDVSYCAHPEWFSALGGLKLRTMSRRSAARASLVITDSLFSKREIEAHLGVPSSRIKVIYPGTGRSREHNAGGSEPDRADVLFVGSLFNRRHIPALMDGFARLAARHRGGRLTIVGENRTHPHIDFETLRRRTGVADRIGLMSYVADDALETLYSTARAFAYLSEYEGFGFPPLEALARGIPIVVLDTAVAREVYGGAAIYVARPDGALVGAALEQAIDDEATRRRVLAAAPSVLARYTWRDCAAGVLDALTGL